MLEELITWVSSVLIISGLFVFFCAAIGFLRFPDFYTRMHATGKGDTLGILLVLSGLILYGLYKDFSWMGLIKAVKILTLVVFWYVASPTATHALLRAAFESGIEPYTKNGRVIIDKVDTDCEDKKNVRDT
ncbi:MAG: monovalent cation/H(+) antiporter subunit G [Desulfobacterota bacterium]|nr:monovalent cation/H(+) antiporter subunit G [Thermodesulfobacteriota bacterium]MDW8002138.1 monovalent cation/H(+) antiporter subunit G [Deltaproteobacteria bacterium]